MDIYPFVGEIRLYGGINIPIDPQNPDARPWVFCDGSLLDVNHFYDLFIQIGNAYGGDGHSTFAVPDLRGRVPIHIGTQPGALNVNMFAQFGGEYTAVLPTHIPVHSHGMQTSAAVAETNVPTDNLIAVAETAVSFVKDAKAEVLVKMSDKNVAPYGYTDNTILVMQNYMPINYIISTSGRPVRPQ